MNYKKPIKAKPDSALMGFFDFTRCTTLKVYGIPDNLISSHCSMVQINSKPLI